MYLVTLEFTNLRNRKCVGEWAVSAAKRDDAIETVKNLASPAVKERTPISVQRAIKIKPAAMISLTEF